eukprot:Tbor_TRINITY_DN9151_c0_g1::TRINITY_DN9151_c0_g1_i1::g.14452::m.14452
MTCPLISIPTVNETSFHTQSDVAVDASPMSLIYSQGFEALPGCNVATIFAMSRLPPKSQWSYRSTTGSSTDESLISERTMCPTLALDLMNENATGESICFSIILEVIESVGDHIKEQHLNNLAKPYTVHSVALEMLEAIRAAYIGLDCVESKHLESDDGCRSCWIDSVRIHSTPRPTATDPSYCSIDQQHPATPTYTDMYDYPSPVEIDVSARYYLSCSMHREDSISSDLGSKENYINLSQKMKFSHAKQNTILHHSRDSERYECSLLQSTISYNGTRPYNSTPIRNISELLCNDVPKTRNDDTTISSHKKNAYTQGLQLKSSIIKGSHHSISLQGGPMLQERSHQSLGNLIKVTPSKQIPPIQSAFISREENWLNLVKANEVIDVSKMSILPSSLFCPRANSTSNTEDMRHKDTSQPLNASNARGTSPSPKLRIVKAVKYEVLDMPHDDAQIIAVSDESVGKRHRSHKSLSISPYSLKDRSSLSSVLKKSIKKHNTAEDFFKPSCDINMLVEVKPTRGVIATICPTSLETPSRTDATNSRQTKLSIPIHNLQDDIGKTTREESQKTKVVSDPADHNLQREQKRRGNRKVSIVSECVEGSVTSHHSAMQGVRNAKLVSRGEGEQQPHKLLPPIIKGNVRRIIL